VDQNQRTEDAKGKEVSGGWTRVEQTKEGSLDEEGLGRGSNSLKMRGKNASVGKTIIRKEGEKGKNKGSLVPI